MRWAMHEPNNSTTARQTEPPNGPPSKRNPTGAQAGMPETLGLRVVFRFRATFHPTHIAGRRGAVALTSRGVAIPTRPRPLHPILLAGGRNNGSGILQFVIRALVSGRDLGERVVVGIGDGLVSIGCSLVEIGNDVVSVRYDLVQTGNLLVRIRCRLVCVGEGLIGGWVGQRVAPPESRYTCRLGGCHSP